MHQNAAGNGRFARQGAVVSIFRLLNFPGTCTLKQIELIWNISRHRCIDSNCNRAVYWLHERASLSQLSVEALVVVFIITRSQPSFLFPLPPPLTTTPPTHTQHREKEREKERKRLTHTHKKNPCCRYTNNHENDLLNEFRRSSKLTWQSMRWARWKWRQ